VAKPTQSEADRLAAEELEKNPAAPKGRATPTRKEREAARKRPLVGDRSPEARKASRAAEQAQRDRARVGMANGEEKFLPAKDRGAQKRYIRDYVDARWNFGELMIPIVVILFITLLLPINAQSAVNLGLYALVLIIIIDSVVLGWRLGRKLNAKFGAENVQKYRFYAAMRAIYLRQLRMPKPQAKRGQFPS
jgi:hypothetical protein